MWWPRRKPAHWVAACRDLAGRRREILVVPADGDRVALVFPSGQVVVLDLLQAGRLRGALRHAVIALETPRASGEYQFYAIPTVRAGA
jgi:hypothetical protein